MKHKQGGSSVRKVGSGEGFGKWGGMPTLKGNIAQCCRSSNFQKSKTWIFIYSLYIWQPCYTYFLHLIIYLIINYILSLFIYLLRESMSETGAEKEGERVSQTGSASFVQCPMQGLNLRTMRP